MGTIRVMLADDHQLMRTGIRAVLQAMPEVEIVGEASSGPEAVRMARQLRPDLVLMDIRLPELDGFAATRQIKSDSAETRVIMLSSYSHEEYVLQAVGPEGVGADGYVRKEDSPEHLREAIASVMRGQTYLTPVVATRVLDYLNRTRGSAKGGLSPQQREVLILMAKGQTTKEIAETLGLSIKTVETHRSRLMERLGIYDVAGLVRWAIRMGLVSAEE